MGADADALHSAAQTRLNCRNLPHRLRTVPGGKKEAKREDFSRRFISAGYADPYVKRPNSILFNARLVGSCIAKEIRDWAGSHHSWSNKHTARENYS